MVLNVVVLVVIAMIIVTITMVCFGCPCHRSVRLFFSGIALPSDILHSRVGGSYLDQLLLPPIWIFLCHLNQSNLC